jgi:hypothetical protein
MQLLPSWLLKKDSPAMFPIHFTVINRGDLHTNLTSCCQGAHMLQQRALGSEIVTIWLSGGFNRT